MKLLITALTCIPLLASAQSSGKDGGNGGFVYKCGNTLELVDLKEPSLLPKLGEIIRIERTDEDHFDDIIDRKLALIKEIYPEGHEEIAKKTKSVRKSFVKRGFNDPTDPVDLGRVPLPTSCDLVNVIKYSTEAFVKPELFNRLRSTDRAALVLHEALYLMARDASAVSGYSLPDSLPIRRLIAVLFSTKAREKRTLVRDLLGYYTVNFGRAITRIFKYQICVEKKYLENNYPQMGWKFFWKLRIDLLASNNGESQGWTIKGSQLEHQSIACDGTQGESYQAESRPIAVKGASSLGYHVELLNRFAPSPSIHPLDAVFHVKLIEGESIIEESTLDNVHWGIDYNRTMKEIYSFRPRKLSPTAQYLIEN